MDAFYTERSEGLFKAAAEFGRGRLSPGLKERDARGELDLAVWQECAEFGLLGLPVPEPYGGVGEELPGIVRTLEGLGYGCLDNGLLFALGAQLWSVEMPILLFGSDAQKERYLPPLAAGRLIGAHAVTEVEAGSDVFSLRTSAVRDGADYVLEGAKTFITSAPVAGLFLVLANTDPALGAKGLTAFLVERDAPGLSVSETDAKMGLRTAPWGTVTLDRCRVSAASVLGNPGGGGAVFAAAMEWERCYILVPALGAMRRQLESCIEYARARRQFGRPIGKNQSVANEIVEMRLRLETSRLLAYRTASTKQAGRRLTLEPSEVKLHLSESWVRNALGALQIHGAAGYATELGIERDLRDALASRIYSGSSAIQRMIIAEFLGL